MEKRIVYHFRFSEALNKTSTLNRRPIPEVRHNVLELTFSTYEDVNHEKLFSY